MLRYLFAVVRRKAQSSNAAPENGLAVPVAVVVVRGFGCMQVAMQSDDGADM